MFELSMFSLCCFFLSIFFRTKREKEDWLESLFEAIKELYQKKSSLKLGREVLRPPDAEIGKRQPHLLKLDAIHKCMECSQPFSMMRKKYNCRACGVVSIYFLMIMNCPNLQCMHGQKCKNHVVFQPTFFVGFFNKGRSSALLGLHHIPVFQNGHTLFQIWSQSQTVLPLFRSKRFIFDEMTRFKICLSMKLIPFFLLSCWYYIFNPMAMQTYVD